MASQETGYVIYTTEDDGATLTFLAEQKAYNRKEAIGKALRPHDIAAMKEAHKEALKALTDGDPDEVKKAQASEVEEAKRYNETVAALSAKVEDPETSPEDRPAFIVSPHTSFQVVRPTVETKVVVTFA